MEYLFVFLFVCVTSTQSRSSRCTHTQGRTRPCTAESSGHVTGALTANTLWHPVGTRRSFSFKNQERKKTTTKQLALKVKLMYWWHQFFDSSFECVCVFVCVQVIVWGPCRLEDTGDSAPPPEIKPCSSILDVGDAATAVAFCPVLCSDKRYTHTHTHKCTWKLFLLYILARS